MRIAGEIDHPVYKITIMQHMGRFTLKIESNATEQSYKIRESDEIRTAEDIKAFVDEKFMKQVDKTFLDLSDNLIHLLANAAGDEEDGEMIDGII